MRNFAACVGLGLALSSGFVAGACGQACGAAGCGASAILKLAAPIDPSSSAAYHVTICRNADCATADLPTLDDSQGVPLATGVQFSVRGDLYGRLTPQNGDLVMVELVWSFFGANAETHNGERYTVDIVATATGASVARLDKVATYAPYYPNGSDCGPPCFRVVLGES